MTGGEGSRPRAGIVPAWPWCLVVIVLFLAVNAVVLRSGVRLGGDSSRYVDGGDDLFALRPLEDKAASYLGYVFIVGAVRTLHLGLPVVVGIQLVVHAVAAAATYFLGRRLCGAAGGVLATALYVGNVDVSRWNAYVLTDSPYTSMVVISTLTFVRAAEEPSRSRVLTFATTVLATALVRPTGWFVVPVAAVGLVLVTRRANLPVRAVSGAVAVVLMTAAVVGLAAGSEEEAPATPLFRGDVLWQSTTWRRSMPAPDDPDDHSLSTAFAYTTRHPAAVAEITAARVAAELGHVRPFYSAVHNAAIVAWLLPLYLLAAVGTWSYRTHLVVRVIAAVTALHLVAVALTFADHDGRFLTYVVPLLGVAASAGALRTWDRIRAASTRFRLRPEPARPDA